MLTDPIQYNVNANDGTTDATSAISRAISDAAGSEALPGGVYFPPGTYRISSALTVPANCIFLFAPGALLSVDSGASVHFQGPQGVYAGIYQIFKGMGEVKFLNDSAPGVVYPEWWGAQKGVAAFDNGPAFNAMISALNNSSVVLTGIYYHSTRIVIDRACHILSANPQGCGFVWTGGADVQLDILFCSSVWMQNFTVANQGAATVGIRFLGLNHRFTQLYLGANINGVAHNGYTTAAIKALQTAQNPTTQNIYFDGVQVFSQVAGKENAIAYDIRTSANTVVFVNCWSSGNKIGWWIGDHTVITGSGATVDGFAAYGCRAEAGSGASLGAPGGPGAIGFLLDAVNCPCIEGGSSELCGDQSSGGEGNRAIKTVQVRGGGVSKFKFNGDGVATAAITISGDSTFPDADTVGFGISDCTFIRLNGYGVEVTGTEDLSKINWGLNARCGGNTLGIFKGPQPVPPTADTGFSF